MVGFRGASQQDHSALFKRRQRGKPHAGERIALRAFANGWTLAELERYYIEAVLDSVDGNAKRAAEILGINRMTIARKRKAGKIR